jgi:two-component system response regulator PilR (NtrC family)
VARAIHACSHRADGPFIAVNCSAIPETLLEAEFFGARKGSYTGATADREGYFQAARGGTLFLDEIGDLPLPMQSKLLRAIQERQVRSLGSTLEDAVDVRIVSATHKDLGAEVHGGRFRQDLYYRLNVIQVRMPPLRERVDDLGMICAAVLQRIARDAGVSPAPRLAPDALEHLSHYGFPGNVRELENLLYRAVTLAGAELIEREDLGLGDEAFVDSEWQGLELPPPDALSPSTVPEPAALPRDLVDYLDTVERDVIGRALALHRSNRTAAGASLGLSLRQMRYRMARLGINPGDHGSE